MDPFLYLFRIYSFINLYVLHPTFALATEYYYTRLGFGERRSFLSSTSGNNTRGKIRRRILSWVRYLSWRWERCLECRSWVREGFQALAGYLHVFYYRCKRYICNFNSTITRTGLPGTTFICLCSNRRSRWATNHFLSLQSQSRARSSSSSGSRLKAYGHPHKKE